MTTALEVGERIIALLDEGLFTATYKYAVLLSLLDLTLELGAEVGENTLTLTTRQLAIKVLAAYWPQVRPLPLHRGLIPRQSGRGSKDARIVRVIAEHKMRAPRTGTSSAEVGVKDPKGYKSLVDEVERVLIEMPLPRLQSVGNSNDPFLYRINWDVGVSRSVVNRYIHGFDTTFDNRIVLRAGVASALIQLNGLLRPLIQRSWALKVARLNQLDDAVLHDFLFGSERTSLTRVREPLAEAQHGRCYYCTETLTGTVVVDHFLPWARVPNDNLENLVAAHARCNAEKRDFLPALSHVSKWRPRCVVDTPDSRALAALASACRWPSDPVATLGTARAIYGQLPASAKLWVVGTDFEERGDTALSL